MKLNTKNISLIIVLSLVISLLFSFSVLADKVVTDMTGRKVKVPDQINRVVTTYRSATQFVFCLNVQDRLVAADISFEKISLFQKLYYGDKIPTVGSKRHGLNLEQIIEVDPDLVILFPYGEGPSTAKKLEQFGIASIIIVPESYQQIRKATNLLAEAMGLEDRAKKVTKQYDKILNLVQRSSNIDNKKKVYFANSDLFDTVGEGLLQTSMIEMAGGINSAKTVKSGFIKTSLEELINWNPEYIVVSQYYSNTIDNLLNREELKNLNAIKDGNVFRFPSEVEPWDFPSPSSYLGIIWLAKKIYPEKYEDVDIEKIVNEYYQTLYNKSFTKLGGGNF